ncbi:MAG: alpha/beta hydrolase [Eubacterium sp.]|nr:alpha/beta hydrolase [Eubacterium sp.]
MNKKIWTLSEERNVTLTGYFYEDNDEYQKGIKRPLIIVCPGGGYTFLSEREADPIALRYVSAGFNAAVLRYGIVDYAVAPGPLNDVAGAIKLMRELSDSLFIDKDSIFICGFSAGGHVAGQIGVFWNNEELLPEYKDNFEMIKPNGLILGYPVLDLKASTKALDFGAGLDRDINKLEFGTLHPDIPKERIFVRNEEKGKYLVDFELAMNAFIFGGDYTSKEEDKYCLQNFVSSDTPPTFLWHCAGDNLIYPSNSLDFASALAKAGVDYELHIYNGGGHGIATADYKTTNDPNQYYEAAEGWLDLSIAWINRVCGYKDKIIDKYVKQ